MARAGRRVLAAGVRTVRACCRHTGSKEGVRLTALVTVAVLVVVAAAMLGVPALAAVRPPVRVMLATYAFVLPFGSSVEFPGPPPFNTLSTVVGVAVTLGLLLRLVTTGQFTRHWPGAVSAWVLLVGWLGLTLLWSVDISRSLRAFTILLSLVGLYVVVTLVPLDRRDLRWLELAIVAGAAYVSLRALVLAATGNLRAQEDGTLPRFAIETGDPNITAASLLLPWVLASWWCLNASTWSRRLASLAVAMLLLFAIVLTGSRGALVAVVAAAVALVANSSRTGRWRAWFYVIPVALAGGVAFIAAPPDLQGHLSGTSSTGRSDIWAVGIQSCPDNCLTGSGWGTFSTVYRDVYLERLDLQGFGNRTWAAHNIALSTLIEGGVLGLTLLVLGFVLVIVGLARLSRAHRGPPMAAVVALLASNMLLSNVNFKYFWLTLIYATACISVYVGERADAPALPAPADPVDQWAGRR